MRNPRGLFIPFRFPGYPEALVSQQVDAARKRVESLGIDLVVANQVVNDADADRLREGFSPSNVDFILLLVPTWIEPPLVVRAAKPFFGKPTILWGFTTFPNDGWRVHMGGMAGSGAVHGSLREMGVPHLYIYGMPDNEQIGDKINNFANLARARALLDESKIGMVGYVFSGMHAAGVDNASLRMKIGPEIEHIDTYTLVRNMEGIDDGSEPFKTAAKVIAARLAPATPLGKDELSRVARMYVALQQLCLEKNLNAITVKCHYELSQQFGQSACIPLSVLGDSVVASCEADLPVVITQLILHYLSRGETTSYVDFHDLADGKLLVGACGYAPVCMCSGGRIICGRPGAGGLGATFSGLIVNSSPMKSGKVTLARLLKQAGAYTIHYVAGEALGDVGDVCELDCPKYPTTEIRLDTDADLFGQRMGSHHYALVYGDLRGELAAFCAMMNIGALVG